MADTTSYVGDMGVMVRDAFHHAVIDSVSKAVGLLDVLTRYNRKKGLPNGFIMPPHKDVKMVGGQKFVVPIRLEHIDDETSKELSTPTEEFGFPETTSLTTSEWDRASFVTSLGIADDDIESTLAGDYFNIEGIKSFVTAKVEAAIDKHVSLIHNKLTAPTKTQNLWNMWAVGGGVDGLLTDDGSSAAVGKLSSAEHENWKNQTVTTNNFATAREGLIDFGTLISYIAAARGNPTVMFASALGVSYIHAAGVAVLERNEVRGDPFEGMLTWNKMPIVLDYKIYTSGTATRFLLLDLDHIQFIVTKSSVNGKPNFANLLPPTRAANQLVQNQVIVTKGAVVLFRRNCHGVQVINA